VHTDRNPHSALSLLNASFPGHIDLPRAREGHLGGAFWTVWAPCPDVLGDDPGPDFLNPTNHLRDALEMLDLIQGMISVHADDLQFARSSFEVMEAFKAGKVASLIGLEGTHVLGNSLSSMRLLAQLGVRYVTLTHTCHSAFASSCGQVSGEVFNEVHEGNGLSALGRELVKELNRLGVMVDLSHTSVETMQQVIEMSEAPVVWTHSGSRALWDHPRNVPDDVLAKIGDGPGRIDGVVQSVFFPPFIGPYDEENDRWLANVSRVADHIEHIAGVIGRTRVGIASDFDGMYLEVEGLEDATKYPNLVAELISRGWSDGEVNGVMGGNLMRIMDKVDAVAEAKKSDLPSPAVWEKRRDLPATKWGGGGHNTYWPADVKKKVEDMGSWRHDEL
jgi:membrane dipeptidase